jgi:hypothetical protein
MYLRFREIRIFLKIMMPVLCIPVLVQAQYIGLSNPNPLGPLSLRNGPGTKVLLWGGDLAQPHYGFGNINNEFRFHSDASFAHIGFGTGRSAAFNEVVRINNSTGNVGIGTTNPTQVLDVNGTFRLAPYDSIGPNPYFIRYKTPSWLYFANSDNTATPIRLGSYASLGAIFLNYFSNFGFFRQSDGKLLLGTNPSGALLINGSAGTAGQVLRSDDYYGEVKWRYTSSEEAIITSSNAAGDGAYSLTNSVAEMALLKPGETNSTAGNAFQLTYPSKMIVRFQTNPTVFTCCGPSVFDVQVVVNENALRTFRFAIENGGNKQMGASTMFTLSPGTYRIKLRAYRVSGPAIQLSGDYSNSDVGIIIHPFETSVSIIPNPYY